MGWRELIALLLLFGSLLAAAPGVWAQQLQQQPQQPLLVVEQGHHSAPVRRIAVDAARGLAVTASDDRTARVWDLNSGELRHVLRPLAFGVEGGRLYGAAIHPSRPLVAVGGTTGGSSGGTAAGTTAGESNAHLIYLFDLDTGALLRSVDARAGNVRKLAWSHDGSLLLAAYAGTHGFKAFSLDGKPVLEEALDGPVFGIAVAANGLAAVVGLDGSLRTYRAQAGAATPLLRLSLGQRRAAGVSFSPDGRQLAVAFANATVGANNRESFHDAVEVFDTESGRSLAKLPVLPMFGGDLRTVAWSADGKSVFAGGTAYTKEGNTLAFPIVQYDVAARSTLGVTRVASDSVTDLVALPGGGVAYSSFDGSWGVLNQGRATPRSAPRVSAIRGDTPEDLELSADARSLRWGMQTVGGGLGFQFKQRQLSTKPQAAWRAPQTGFSLFNRPSEWNLSRGTPMVAGKPLALAQDERSRALVVVRATKSAVIGTNRALYKLDDQGTLLWRVPVDTEVRAVNASEDGRWITTALADGTVQWHRAQDGVHLLTLLADADGRWVLWTPSGYYDASAGADRLVGWAVGKGQQQAMDFYSLNRFRERFNRPDVIDAVLDTLDEKLALDSLRARDLAARDQATAEARAREQEATAAIRAAAEATAQAQQARQREAQARVEAEQSAREAAAKAEALRVAEARRTAAQQKAEQNAERAAEKKAERESERATAEREAATRFAEAREAAARDAATQRAALEAERQRTRLAAEQEAATRLAAAREAAAALALAEASAREAAMNERKVLAVIKALEVPPALSAPENKRIKLAAPEVTLPFSVSSSGSAKDVSFELRVNGRPAQASELVPPPTLDGSARGFAKVSVAEGESLVEILARNPYGVSEPLSFKIERALSAAAAAAEIRPGPTAASPPRPAGDLYVLAIGVSDYVRADYRLGLAAKDAIDFSNAMKAQAGKQYRQVIVRTLTNREATRANIDREFEWLRRTAGPTDVAMLFMAGHGLNDSTGQYYFLPADGQHERLASTAVAQTTIVATLSKIRAKTLLFLDTCFAGNSLGALRQSGRQTEKMMNDLSSSENGVVVFASSTGQEESEEKAEWGNGAFTKALIEGLGGKADFMRAGRVTYAALNLFLSEEVTRLTQGRQRPVFISPRGIPDFALVRL